MKSYNFKTLTTNIKSDSLSKMIDAAMSSPDINRAAVSKLAGVSLPTAGKLLAALDECKITNINYKRDGNIGHPIKYRCFSEQLSALIIDLSSEEYCASVIDGRAENRFFKTYLVDPAVSFIDNVVSFLSKIASDISNASFGVSAISVIFKDDSDPLSLSNKRKYAPDLSQSDTVSFYIAKFFGVLPIACVKESDAVFFAFKYRVHPLINSQKDTAFIYIGNNIFASFFSNNGYHKSCNIEDLLITDSKTLSTALESAISSEDYGHVLFRAVNLMSCAFSPSRYIIEYDFMRFNNLSLNSIKRNFALTNSKLPEIIAIDHSSGLARIGAARMTISEYVKRLITGI